MKELDDQLTAMIHDPDAYDDLTKPGVTVRAAPARDRARARGRGGLEG